MMKISRKADYALRAVIFLARKKETKEVHMISTISTETGVTKGFMAKILKELNNRGIVTAQKGANGGYRLSKDPSSISFKDVIEAIEGPFEINDCVPNPELCERTDICEMYHIWIKAYKAFTDVFAQTKMSDLLTIISNKENNPFNYKVQDKEELWTQN